MMEIGIPIRADHRYLYKVISLVLGHKVESVPSQFDMLSQLFQKNGGSWYRIFATSSPQDVSLLKKLIRQAYKAGLLTKKESWHAKNGSEQLNENLLIFAQM